MTLYADDLLLCLANPTVFLPVLLDYGNLFGNIYGYTINWEKSDFMFEGKEISRISRHLVF